MQFSSVVHCLNLISFVFEKDTLEHTRDEIQKEPQETVAFVGAQSIMVTPLFTATVFQ